MIAPPPAQNSSPSEILEGEGQKRYLQSLESKLNRLEGGNKRNIKSKDILSALTEARDDHLYQSSLDTQPATLSVTEDTAATNDPWSSTNTSGYITDLSSTGDMQETGGRDGALHQLDDDIDGPPEMMKTGCLPCCSKRKHYRHSRVRITSATLTPEEESAFLLHCDHLSKT